MVDAIVFQNCDSHFSMLAGVDFGSQSWMVVGVGLLVVLNRNSIMLYFPSQDTLTFVEGPYILSNDI